MNATIPKGTFLTLPIEPTFVAFLHPKIKHMSMAFRTIFSDFSEMLNSRNRKIKLPITPFGIVTYAYSPGTVLETAVYIQEQTPHVIEECVGTTTTRWRSSILFAVSSRKDLPPDSRMILPIQRFLILPLAQRKRREI